MTKTLMIQGTTSDAGKTTLVAGLCRLFAGWGISVAPFKPQNMALNSAVTQDGGEIGRSQALQAHACGLEPHTDMNPILLKPNSDTGAQVIVHGRALDNMEAKAYQKFKATALNYALQSHQRLADQYSLVMVEGAGSPAEINLRENDVANMGFAEAADCPVILVADIDRGGVFAHLVGTLELLSESEQNRVVGFIINRFRGDIKLLENGLDWLEERTGKPVLAVLPYLHNLSLDQEDAIDTSQPEADEIKGLKGVGVEHVRLRPLLDQPLLEKLLVKIPVFPRISNHTDFDVLRLHPQVDVEYVGEGDSLVGADLILLPGSKSVRADLAWFKKQGFDQDLQRHLRFGGKVIGLCGGFQMLGSQIDDPLAIEGVSGSSSGLGYLEMTTELGSEKKLTQVSGILDVALLNNSARNQNQAVAIRGYEIHCGQSRGAALNNPLIHLQTTSGQTVPEGAIHESGQILGSYVHGLFDHPQALPVLLEWAGLSHASSLDRDQIRDQELDRLAKAIEKSMDWQEFQRVCGFGKPAGFTEANRSNPSQQGDTVEIA